MHKRKTFHLVICVLLIGLTVGWVKMGASSPDNRAEAARQVERPLLLTHYMPWYQTPDVSGYWGWHWTMNHFDPEQVDENGRRQIASHYMPLTGPYDSSDEAVLEYQVLLMKLSGIDGVIVDWYGNDNFRDYAVLNESTNKLFSLIQRAGMTFVLCYEDQTIKHMVDNGYIAVEDAVTRGQETMQYAHDQWFGDAAYLKFNGQPILFTFGPQYFRGSNDWVTMFSELEPAPALITLDNHRVLDALGSFAWPPMRGVNSNQAVIEAYMTEFYRKAERWDYLVGGAFPGFHDIYAEAGVRATYGYLDAEQGALFRFTLQLAVEQSPNVIQLVTWNDYGEGTGIEPTEEFGYQYLEIVQETRRSLNEGDFEFTAEQLTLPLQLFNLRKAYTGDAEVNAQLDQVFDVIIAGDIESATRILASFQ